MTTLVQLAWPLVALLGLCLGFFTLVSWRSLGQEKTSKRDALVSEMSERLIQVSAVLAQHDFESIEERLESQEQRLAKLLTVEGSQKVLETVNAMVKDLTELKVIVVHLRDAMAVRGVLSQERAA